MFLTATLQTTLSFPCTFIPKLSTCLMNPTSVISSLSHNSHVSEKPITKEWEVVFVKHFFGGYYVGSELQHGSINSINFSSNVFSAWTGAAEMSRAPMSGTVLSNDLIKNEINFPNLLSYGIRRCDPHYGRGLIGQFGNCSCMSLIPAFQDTFLNGFLFAISIFLDALVKSSRVMSPSSLKRQRSS